MLLPPLVDNVTSHSLVDVQSLSRDVVPLVSEADARTILDNATSMHRSAKDFQTRNVLVANAMAASLRMAVHSNV